VTTIAQGASQSYTITPNSGFAVATLVVDGAAVAKSTTHTFTNVQANHTISATFTAAQAGDIVLSLVPARTSGVAPLAVFFDASGTTDVAVTARPFHDLEYTWDFGDPGAGTWTYGAQPGVNSKNSATGPVAAHVFEQPGTYSVSVTAFDGTNTVTTSKTISVTSPDTVFSGTATVCVSTSGTFTGCPSGATHITTSNLPTALGNISSTVKRILLRRDETWTASATSNVTQPGPGLIGAYGAGTNKPFVQVSGNSHSTITFPTGVADDWRVMDMAFDAAGTSSTNIIQLYDRTQITLLRLDVTNSNGAYDTGNSTIPNTDQFTVQDSTANGLTCEDGQGCVQAWVYGTRFAFQGNHLDNTRPGTAGVIGGEHVLRFPKVTRGVISNNDAWNPGLYKSCLKLHSDNRPTEAIFDGTYTEEVVIADNYFKGSTGTPYPVAIMPQNGVVDERLKNIIFERNYATEVGSLTLVTMANTVGGTIRNNILNLGSTGTYGIEIGGNVGDGAPPADLIFVYNNTLYGTHVHNADAIHGVLIGATPISTTVRNNLVIAPNDSGATDTWNTGVMLIKDHNLVSTTVSSILVSGTPSVPADFALKSGSAAIGYGTALPVFEDFIRAVRGPTTWDVGAYAH
jgi:hypothetical protein